MLQSRGNFLNERHYSEHLASEIESLTAERNELKRRLDEEFANMDATMQGWEKLCADSERDALQIESLTAERDRLLEALELCIEAYHEPTDVTASAANMLHIIENALKGH